MSGKWASIIGVLLAASACTGQCGPTAKTPVTTTPSSSVPSPSPTPTAPLQASSSPFHGGEVGVAYGAVSLSASGGVAPYKWSVNTGALPAGLNLGPEGTVSGTPNSAGNFSFTIQVADAGDSTASIAGTIGIAPALTAGLIAPCAQYCNVEVGCVSVCGAFGQQSGGAGPYTYALTQGPLPSGTSLNGLSLTGTFKGSSGWLQFTVQVNDALGGTASLSPKFWMYDHISLSSGKCYSPYYRTTPCTTSLPYTGGTPNTALSVGLVSANGQLCTQGVTGGVSCTASSSAPPGFTATVGTGTVNINVPASPNYYFMYNGVVNLRLTDQDPCAQGSSCNSGGSVQVTVQAG